MQPTVGRPYDVTVIVATHARADLLADLFAALAAQDFAGTFDVVVTDDGSPDDTWPRLQTLAAAAPFPVHLERHPRSTGPAGARNTAARHATGAILAFTDDDCRPEPSWLRAGVEAMGAAHRVVVGHVRPPDPDARLRPNQRKLSVQTWSRFETANAFYRRTDFDAVGGFHDGFDGPGGEDLDLGMRVLALGAEAHYEPGAVVVHPVRTLTTRGAIREARRWTGVTLAIKRHPQLRHELLFRPWIWKRSHQWFLVGVAGTAAAVVTRRPVLLGAWAPWVRRKFEDQGYDGLTVAYLPQSFMVDAAEIATLARTSVRDRIFIL